MIAVVWTRRRLLVAGVTAGMFLRILHTITSIGSPDAVLWFRNVEMVELAGFFPAYVESSHLNHPPLAMLLAVAVTRLGALFGLLLPDSFRLLQIAADLVTCWMLARIASRLSADAVAVCLMFALSPAAIFVTGFHCNSDPLMTMFGVVAVAMLIENRPIVAGLALAAGAGIKIPILLLFPVLWIHARGAQRLKFLGACAAGGGAIFLPPLIAVGYPFLERVLLYTGTETAWGLPYVWSELGSIISGLPPIRSALRWLLLAALGTVWLTEWAAIRRGGMPAPRRLPALTGVTILTMLFLAPGFGVQYLFWPLPWLALAFPARAALLLHGAFSLFLFGIYTAWSEEWPWWFAGGGSGPEFVWAGVAVWALIGVYAAWGWIRIRRTP
jgi:hypothetical protein